MVYEKFKNDLILRDLLAIDRTNLANERTLLAYLRTAIMTLISGITLIKLFHSIFLIRIIGYLSIPISLLLAIFATIRFFKMKKKMDSLV